MHVFAVLFDSDQPGPCLFSRHVFQRYRAKLRRKNHQFNSHSHQFTRWFHFYAAPGALHKYNQSFFRLEDLNQLHLIYMIFHPLQLYIHLVHACLVLNSSNLCFRQPNDFVPFECTGDHFLCVDELLLQVHVCQQDLLQL